MRAVVDFVGSPAQARAAYQNALAELRALEAEYPGISESPDPDGIIWQSPPPYAPRGNAFDYATLEPMRRQPGRWALIRTLATPHSAKSVCWSLKHRKPPRELPEGRWEFTSRECSLYARYLGPEDMA